MIRRRLARWIATAVVLAVIASAQGAQEGDAPPDSSSTYDCGVLALYHLLQLEGRPTELSRIDACLPPRKRRGYSMKELRDAARACGLTLAGVRLRLREDGRAPVRPVLALLNRRPYGHYLIVRPIGHTGKLVQVLDGVRTPYVIDAAKLYASPEWTRLALVPERPNWPLRIGGGVAVTGLLALFIVRHARRSGDSGMGRHRAAELKADSAQSEEGAMSISERIIWQDSPAAAGRWAF